MRPYQRLCTDFRTVTLVWPFRSPHHLCRGFVMRTSEPKPHQINRFSSVLSIPKFETWLRKMMRTSESGRWQGFCLAKQGSIRYTAWRWARLWTVPLFWRC